ncbi:MAG: zf-HC2 domain-containing protein [Pyrinomonadaceae bacterium]|nr:zf-HC2 domain-containing protein [Pyrinomonadaceae bacterium]
MKCLECLPLVEEYVDGELNVKDAERVTAHVAACKSCAGAVDALLREQEIYAGYQREVEVMPAMWQNVRARIEAEKATPPVKAEPRIQGWLAALFGTRLLLRRPAFAVALVLIALGITSIALLKFLGSRQQPTIAEKDKTPSGIQNVNTPLKVETPDKINKPETTADVKKDEPRPATGGGGERERKTKEAFVAKDSPRSETRQPVNVAPLESSAQVVERDAIENYTSVSAPRVAGAPELEIARHVEQAQLLLRSFRNVRLAETSHAPDILYEKEQSRRLLYKNIVLRREAHAEGNAPAEKLLGMLEPILLDIANLPDRATARDVLSIERRMQKKEIVAALQVHAIQAPNSY